VYEKMQFVGDSDEDLCNKWTLEIHEM